jgi:hypothetical protein
MRNVLKAIQEFRQEGKEDAIDDALRQEEARKRKKGRRWPKG